MAYTLGRWRSSRCEIPRPSQILGVLAEKEDPPCPPGRRIHVGRCLPEGRTHRRSGRLPGSGASWRWPFCGRRVGGSTRSREPCASPLPTSPGRQRCPHPRSAQTAGPRRDDEWSRNREREQSRGGGSKPPAHRLQLGGLRRSRHDQVPICLGRAVILGLAVEVGRPSALSRLTNCNSSGHTEHLLDGGARLCRSVARLRLHKCGAALGSGRERDADVRRCEGELSVGGGTGDHVLTAVGVNGEPAVRVGAGLGLGQPPVAADEAT